MSELNVKESAIKLFGRTIPLVLNHGVSSDYSVSSSLDASLCDDEREKKPSKRKLMEEMEEDDSSHHIAEDLNNPTTSSDNSENPKTPSVDRETSSVKTSKSEGKSEGTKSEETSLKKPDKIVPCPRCNSMETKFCYYNNYNVNQPRHFCKNCQRYWTAGGTMRNVPVGAGRRKNKNPLSSQYRQIILSEPLQRAHANARNGVHNGTVLAFGSESYICESIPPDKRSIVSCVGGYKGDDRSIGLSITAASSSEKECINGVQGFPPQVFPGPPWPYPWNSVQWNSAMPPPAFVPAGYPMSFCPPPAYWGCNVPGAWTIPCLSTNPNPVSVEKQEVAKQNIKSETHVSIPKTLRIDDLAEAAKSSIWTTLGIKLDKKTNSTTGGGLFEAFQSIGENKNHGLDTSPALHANPAALSRSFNFHEST